MPEEKNEIEELLEFAGTDEPREVEVEVESFEAEPEVEVPAEQAADEPHAYGSDAADSESQEALESQESESGSSDEASGEDAGGVAADPMELLQRQVLELSQQLNELRGGGVPEEDEVIPEIGLKKSQLSGVVKYLQDAGIVPKAEPKKDAEIDFVKSDDDLPSDYKALNSLLNTVYQAAQQASLQRAYPVITNEVARSHALYQLSREFYRVNPDLKGKEALVQLSAQDLVRQKPNIQPEELYKRAAIETRKRLGMKDPKRPALEKPANLANKKPGFAGTSQQSRQPMAGPPKRSLSDELDELKRVL